MTNVESMKCGVLAIFVAAFFYYIPDYFRTIDCANATRALRHIAACEESGECMLTSKELEMKDVYTRLQTLNCEKD